MSEKTEDSVKFIREVCYMKNQIDENQSTIDEQLDAQLDTESSPAEDKSEPLNKQPVKRQENTTPEKDLKILSVGDWMITILFYIIPVVNLIMMAIWAFSSRGNIHRRNLSRALLLWWIIILVAYVVAMTVAGFTILDIFRGKA
jgi:heme/copper-type cytochrome/quinol oxidase subunit 2